MKYLRIGNYIYARITAPDFLWYEDEDGNKLYLEEDGKKVPFSTKDSTEPEGARYQISQFPSQLTTSYLKLVDEKEVAECPHPEKYVLLTFGWVDGVEGRECKQCFGIQTKNTSDPWPEEWEAYGSRSVMEGHSGWPEDLVLAMANDGYPLGEAILIVAHLCEGCLNVMLYHYGTGDGYELDSEGHTSSGTSCDFCDEVRDEVTPQPPIEKSGPTRLVTFDDIKDAAKRALSKVYDDVDSFTPEELKEAARQLLIADQDDYEDVGFTESGRWGNAGSGLLFTTGERLLLLERSPDVEEPGMWGLPGGAIPEKEDGLRDALKSAETEAAEELGSFPKYRLVNEYVYEEPDFTFTTFVGAVQNEFIPSLNWENTDYAWVSKSELADYDLHFGVIELLENVEPFF